MNLVSRFSFFAPVLLGVALAAGEVPFGHADWRPSPTDPVGFAGQGSNWYPGATPPVAWWEGTPTVIKGKIGNRAHTFNYGEYPRPAELNAYADNKSKNILWKAPLPGWSDSNGTTLVDAATGKERSELPRAFRGGVATLAGNLLILARNDVDAVNARMREDRMTIASFAVFDVSDPARPRLVSDRNLLGNADMPRDIADKYFPDFRKPDLKIFALGCYRGLGSYFGVRTGGVTAHGARLFIQSQTHLYCIGEK
jgi:hypothetical protein